MHLAVIADQSLGDQFVENDALQISFHQNFDTIFVKPDVIFYLCDESTLLNVINLLSTYNCPVVVNAVNTLLSLLPSNFCRLNAWPGFLQRQIKEVSAKNQDEAFFASIFKWLGWEFRFVADLPGFLAARIIAMIINEAWFAYADGISTQADIDLAMKLGTNYPYGPFEWSQKIGIVNIINLLQNMAQQNNKYAPAPLLLQQVNNGVDFKY